MTPQKAATTHCRPRPDELLAADQIDPSAAAAACRSTGPDGQPCGKKRGHRIAWHGPGNPRWINGVNAPAEYLPARVFRTPAFAATSTLAAGQSPCRSVGPADQPCELPRGHRNRWHSGLDRKRWEGGVKDPAFPEPIDNGENSEHDYFRPQLLRSRPDRWGPP